MVHILAIVEAYFESSLANCRKKLITKSGPPVARPAPARRSTHISAHRIDSRLCAPWKSTVKNAQGGGLLRVFGPLEVFDLARLRGYRRQKLVICEPGSRWGFPNGAAA
jgi:hypothetical protein